MSQQIFHLFTKPTYLPLVASWIYNEFWVNKNLLSENDLKNLLLNANSSDSIPQSLIAFKEDVPVGTVNLIENDDDKRTHLRPWLAALYVVPTARRSGIGSILVKECLNSAKTLGEKEIYLGTDNPNFYVKLGAKEIEKTATGLSIMRFDLK